MKVCNWCGSDKTKQIGSEWCSPVLLCEDCGHEFYGEPNGDEVEEYLTMLNEIAKTVPTE